MAGAPRRTAASPRASVPGRGHRDRDTRATTQAPSDAGRDRDAVGHRRGRGHRPRSNSTRGTVGDRRGRRREPRSDASAAGRGQSHATTRGDSSRAGGQGGGGGPGRARQGGPPRGQRQPPEGAGSSRGRVEDRADRNRSARRTPPTPPRRRTFGSSSCSLRSGPGPRSWRRSEGEDRERPAAVGVGELQLLRDGVTRGEQIRDCASLRSYWFRQLGIAAARFASAHTSPRATESSRDVDEALPETLSKRRPAASRRQTAPPQEGQIDRKADVMALPKGAEVSMLAPEIVRPDQRPSQPAVGCWRIADRRASRGTVRRYLQQSER